MSQHFTKLSDIYWKNLYDEGAPILLEAGAIVRETGKQGILVQLKLKSISNDRIVAVRLLLQAYDAFGSPIGQAKEYDYLDQNAERNQCFGTDCAIAFSDPRVRRVDCACVAVVFDNGCIWKAEGKDWWTQLPKQRLLTEALEDLTEQYKRETDAQVQYEVLQDHDLWFCTCRTVNHLVEKNCFSCGRSYQRLLAAMDREQLMRHREAYEREQTAELERQEEENRRRLDQKKQRGWWKSRTAKIGAAALGAALLGLFIGFIGIPFIAYQKGLNLCAEEKYEEAMVQLEKAGPFQSKEKWLRANDEARLHLSYQNAIALIEEGDYQSALDIFGDVTAYPTIEPKEITTRQLLLADTLIEKGQRFLAWTYLIKQEEISISQLKPHYFPMDTISAGADCSVALQKNGTVLSAGNNLYRECDTSEWEAVSVSASTTHTIGLKPDGGVLAAGSNRFGQCDVANWENIVQVAVGGSHTVGLKEDQSVVATGENSHGQCDVAQWENIAAVSAGKDHTVGLRADGTVVAVGLNDQGQCDVSEWSGIVMVDAGNEYTVGLKRDGTVVAVGKNVSNQYEVSQWKDIVSISAGSSITAGLTVDGTVVTTSPAKLIRERISTWKDIVAISVGRDHILGLKADGTVVAAGTSKGSKYNVTDWSDIQIP